MNILRLMGQRGLLGPDAPVRHAARRRRIKTVMQELVDRAGRLVETGRRIILGPGTNDGAAEAVTNSGTGPRHSMCCRPLNGEALPGSTLG